jgi:hypothetical protein
MSEGYASYQPVMTAPENYVVATPQPYYPYFPSQQAGLDTEMRQQQVGIYRPPAQPDASEAQPAPAAVRAVPPPDQPLTELVYHDGRRAEVRNYAVVGQTLWVFSEQRAQKISLSDLDLTATQKANAERGVDFTLPPSH